MDIADSDDLLRRILEYHYDRARGRVSSSAFMKKGKKLDPEVSVFLARVTDRSEILRAGLPRQVLAELKAAVPRSIGLSVRHDPTEQFYGHCVIEGFGDNWKQQCAQLAENAFVRIDDLDPLV